MSRLLIVDDNQQNLYMLQVLLSANGFQVESASNGAEALEQARRAPPEMIITDILMPVMDGYALCREWKKDERLKNIPFVFYTATYTDPKDEEFALSLGADRFIIKPVEPDRFLALLLETRNNYAAGKPFAARQPVEDATYYKEYNAVLIRKLEDKMLQLEESNRALERDIAERKRAEGKLQQSLAEKETLLRELYHRTRNNMQVIRAMLALRAARAKSPAVDAIVRETDRRLQAMSMVHQMLYQSQDLSLIDLRQYVQDLATLLMRSYRLSTERITLEVDAEEARASIDLAVPCGLILNELMSNALLHAFPGDRPGTIRIRLARVAPEMIEMVFSDDGVGVPSGFDPRAQDTLGFRTIIALTEAQLRGEAQFESADGITWRLRFRESPDAPGGQS